MTIKHEKTAKSQERSILYKLISKPTNDGSENEIESRRSSKDFWFTACGLNTLRNSFKSLESCPRELYINFVLKFCDSYGYFTLSQILVIYLHTEFGFSDLEAGTAYGMWGLAITLFGLSFSWINDYLGVRGALLVGFPLSALATSLIASTTSKTVLYVSLFALLPLGNSMGIPMLTVGIRRYTNIHNRGFAFGLFYSVMNLAAFVSGPIVDAFNIGLKDGAVISGRHWSGNRLAILTATITSCCSFFITFFFLREIRVNDSSALDNDDDTTIIEFRPSNETASVSNPISTAAAGADNARGLRQHTSPPSSALMEAGDIEGGNRNKARSLDMGMDVDEDIEMAGHIGEGHHSGRVIGDSHEGGKRGVIDRRYSYSSDTSKISDDELLPSSAAADTNNRHHSDGHSVHLVDGSVVNSSNSRSNIVSTSSTMKIRNPLQRQSAQYSSVPGIEHSGKVVHVANNNNSSTRSDHMQFGEERKEGDRDVEDGDDRDDDDDEPWRRLSSESESALAAAIRGDASDRTNTNTNGNDTDGHTLSAAAPRWTHVDLVSSHGQHSEDQGCLDSERRDDAAAGHTNAVMSNNSPSSGPDSSQTERKGAVHTYTPMKVPLWVLIKQIFSSPTFWRFTALSLLLINLKTIFRHLDATLPTYLIRCFGPKIPKGTIYSINPFMIIFMTPVIAALTTEYAHFNMIKFGSYFTALSPFFLAFSTSIWAVVCMIVVLTIGEAIWSPRLYDYTMSIAPEGKEASFAALSAAPLFAAKVPVGLMSGFLVAKYLPEHGHKDGRTLWLIIGLITLTSPLGITLFERWIREPDANLNDRKNSARNKDRDTAMNKTESQDSLGGDDGDDDAAVGGRGREGRGSGGRGRGGEGRRGRGLKDSGKEYNHSGNNSIEVDAEMGLTDSRGTHASAAGNTLVDFSGSPRLRSSAATTKL